jgi:hypothetical protein
MNTAAKMGWTLKDSHGFEASKGKPGESVTETINR